ncbi:hypothetical protein K1719_015746 [Acacia pycnantha]|nr:hypothetical protein K1719_015746 [Acacia pycnantha]
MEGSQILTPLVWNEGVTSQILVGKILAVKSYTRSAIETILRKAWNLQSGFEVTEITDFGRSPFWIQMHNIPLEALCVKNAVSIGAHVGEVTIAEDPLYNGRYLRNFLRARVILDLRKPLAHGFWLPRPDGRKIWITVKYEKLQSFCYNCGKLGHDNRSCQSEKLMSYHKPDEPRFGSWISTNEVKKECVEAEKWKASRELPVSDEELFSIRSPNPVHGDMRGGYVTERPSPVVHVAENLCSVSTGRTTVETCGPLGTVVSGQDGVEKDSGGPMAMSAGSRDDVVQERAFQEQRSQGTPRVGVENLGTMVIWDGGGMKEVISGIDCLGLKRQAAED